jgi:hypothetical protein
MAGVPVRATAKPGTGVHDPVAALLPTEFRAFHELYRRELVRYAHTCTGCRADAEHAVDAAMLRLYQIWPRVLRHEAPLALAYKVLHGKLADAARRRRDIPVDFTGPDAPELPDGTGDVADRVAAVVDVRPGDCRGAPRRRVLREAPDCIPRLSGASARPHAGQRVRSAAAAASTRTIASDVRLRPTKVRVMQADAGLVPTRPLLCGGGATPFWDAAASYASTSTTWAVGAFFLIESTPFMQPDLLSLRFAGGDDLAVPGFEAEPVFPRLVFVDLELACHVSPPLTSPHPRCTVQRSTSVRPPGPSTRRLRWPTACPGTSPEAAHLCWSI